MSAVFVSKLSLRTKLVLNFLMVATLLGQHAVLTLPRARVVRVFVRVRAKGCL